MNERREIQKFIDAKRAAIDAFERGYFGSLHEQAQGNVSEMARQSGMQRANLRRYLAIYGIGRERAPGGRPSARRTLDRLTEIIQPRDGESLVDAAARVAAAAAKKGKRR
jgi:hypothetical protein